MLVNLDQADVAQELSYDVCIIGAGAAGITLARKLAQAGKRVALCEGGHLEFTGESQDVYLGEVTGDTYFDLDVCRLRYFGGSTNHWGGKARPLDAADFNRDDLGAEMAWPIARADLDPYLEEACNMIEIDAAFDDEVVDPALGVKRIEFKFSPPVNFGEKYLSEIEASDRIHLYLAANFIDLDGDGRRASSAVFANFNGDRFSIPATLFVFATGGIENSRFLLWLQQKHGGQFFDPDLPIGRFWMEHPHFTLGQALVDTSVQAGESFAVTSEVQRAQGILNCGLELDRQGDTGTRRLINELLCIAPSLGEKLLALADRDLVCGVRLRAAWEQAPDFNNRVMLSQTGRDRFAIPSVDLHWTKTDIDRKTILATCATFNDWLHASDLGRLRLEEWLLEDGAYPDNDALGGNHHMGGTRMGTSKQSSVVDQHCRVHGSQNIFVAGSSVFPTGGHANPTLSIVQLSLRLADHLAG